MSSFCSLSSRLVSDHVLYISVRESFEPRGSKARLRLVCGFYLRRQSALFMHLCSHSCKIIMIMIRFFFMYEIVENLYLVTCKMTKEDADLHKMLGTFSPFCWITFSMEKDFFGGSRGSSLTSLTVGPSFRSDQISSCGPFLQTCSVCSHRYLSALAYLGTRLGLSLFSPFLLNVAVYVSLVIVFFSFEHTREPPHGRALRARVAAMHRRQHPLRGWYCAQLFVRMGLKCRQRNASCSCTNKHFCRLNREGIWNTSFIQGI